MPATGDGQDRWRGRSIPCSTATGSGDWPSPRRREADFRPKAASPENREPCSRPTPQHHSTALPDADRQRYLRLDRHQRFRVGAQNVIVEIRMLRRYLRTSLATNSRTSSVYSASANRITWTQSVLDSFISSNIYNSLNLIYFLDYKNGRLYCHHFLLPCEGGGKQGVLAIVSGLKADTIRSAGTCPFPQMPFGAICSVILKVTVSFCYKTRFTILNCCFYHCRKIFFVILMKNSEKLFYPQQGMREEDLS